MAIPPVTYGSIKIIDPILQTQALLSKFMVRGLLPKEELWRILLQHRVRSLRPHGVAQWPRSHDWLMTAKKITHSGTALWGAVWEAGIAVRVGIQHFLPLTREEMLT